MHTRLEIGAGHPVEAWLNGTRVYEGTPGEKAALEAAGVEVELHPGTNRLLLRVTYQGAREALFARLLDPQRKLRYPEERK
jgi:hypothetical protein